MSAPPTAARCAQHRRRPSVAGCTACGERVCSECLVHTPVGIKCSRCTSPRPDASGGRRQRLGVAALVLGAVVVAGVVFVLLRDQQPEETTAGPTGTTADRTGESVVAFTGAEGLRLGGTLRVPDATGPFPGVIIIPGFGPTDRDGVAPPGGMPDRLYQDLAQRLAEAGVASLRYDKRGTGESRLDTDQGLDFDHLVADATAALGFLSERAEIDARAVGLVGHDEGGLKALQMTATAPRVSALALISTPGRPLASVLADDLTASADDPAQGEELAAELHAVVDELLATGELPDPGDLPTALRPVFPPGQEDYLRAVFSIDPAEDAAQVDVPVLVVRGDRDPGVSSEDADRLLAALGGDSEVLVGAEAGHTLALVDREDDTGGSAVTGDRDHDRSMHGGQSGGIERDDELLASVAAWVATTLGAEPTTATEAGGGDEAGDAVTIRITAQGMAFAPDEHHLSAGTYRFVLDNDDDIEHELQLAVEGQHHTHLAGVGPVAPGDNEAFVLDLESGVYEFACHLPGHFEAGMVGTVTVR